MARITPCLENGKIARYFGSDPAVPAHGSTEFIVVRGREGVTTSDFANYLTRSDLVRSYAISQMTGSSGRQRVPADCFNHLEVPVPPLPTQRAIAGVLGALDDKIELNRRMNATLEELARTTFRSWFVDFDPVRAKAAGRAPFGMDAATAARFPDHFVPSALGDIPAGWTPAPVESLATLIRESIQPQQHPVEQYDLYSIPAYDSAKMPARVNGASIKSGKFAVPPDAVLLSKLNPSTPRVWAPHIEDGVQSVASTEFLVLKAINQLHRPFLFCLAQSPAFLDMLVSRASGTSNSHQRVRPSDVMEQQFVQPLPTIHRAFGELALPLLNKVSLNLRESQTLAELRDTLLPKLLSGEISVRAAEREVVAAT